MKHGGRKAGNECRSDDIEEEGRQKRIKGKGTRKEQPEVRWTMNGLKEK